MNTISALQRAVDFIEENILSELGSEIVAGQAYMSDFYFQRLFSVICGISLGEYIRNRRLTLAGEEITATDAKIIDIALKYGYESPESFSRAFAKFHGASPIAVRNGACELRQQPILSIKNILGGNNMVQSLKERGYSVVENGPVYYTKNMDRTAKWFEETLGWYSGIDARDENGDGTYGCVLPIPDEVKNMGLIAFNGFHLFQGEPSDQVVAFMRVDNIEKLRKFVAASGWTKLSEISVQPWGAKECDVTTIDGGIMRFFQVV